MMEFFGSAYFLGIILLALACILFLSVFFPGWYCGHPRRFWLARLTYDNDADQQSFVRLMWIMAWFVALVGSILIGCNHPKIPHTFWWISGQTVFSIISVWLVAKAILAFCILLQRLWFCVVCLKDWALKGKSLFRRKSG